MNSRAQWSGSRYAIPGTRRPLKIHGNLACIVVILACIVVILAWPAAAAPLAERPWNEVRSNHFTVITDRDLDAAKDQLRRLETFRQVVLFFTGNAAPVERVPTRVVLFSRQRDYLKVTKAHGTAGMMAAGLRVNYMMAGAPSKRDLPPEQIMFHEYVHFLLRGDTANYPTWYDEGLAEVFSVMVEHGDNIIVGGNNTSRLRGFGNNSIAHIPLERVVTTDVLSELRPPQRAYYYSMAWALTNYLFFVHLSDGPPHYKQVVPFLTAVHEGADIGTTFERHFGSFADVEKGIEKHLAKRNRGVVVLPRDRLGLEFETTHRQMSPAEVRYDLGYLALRMGNWKFARKMFDGAATPLTVAGLAVTYQFEAKDWDRAFTLARQAITMDEANWLPQLELADMLRSRCRKNDAPKNCDALLAEAEVLYRNILLAVPANPEANLGLGLSLTARKHEPMQAVTAIRVAVDYMPWSANLRYELGHALLIAGHSTEAGQHLRKAANWTHSESLRKKIDADLAVIAEAKAAEEASSRARGSTTTVDDG